MSVNFGKTAPTMFQSKELGAQFVKLDACKGKGASFNGYGIAEGEEITFPTLEQLNSGEYIVKRKTYPGSKNEGYCVRVWRKDDHGERDSYFNVSQLVRQAYTADGVRFDVDEFHTSMRLIPDIEERVAELAGKTIKGVGTLDAYSPKFDEKRQIVRDTWVPAKFTQIEII